MTGRDPRNTIRYFSALLPFQLLKRLHPKRLILPFYHAVSNHPPDHLRHLYRVPGVEEFRRDLDFLCGNYPVLSPDVFLEKGPAHKREGFVLSFDDGLREVKENVLPMLEERGLRAILFLNNDFTGNRGMFYRYKISLLTEAATDPQKKEKLEAFFSSGNEEFPGGASGISFFLRELQWRHIPLVDRLCELMEVDVPAYLNEHRPYLDDSEILEILERGHFIGAHSFDHPVFAELDFAQQLRQTLDSMEELQSRFNPGYRFYAFPFTDHGISRQLLPAIYGGGKNLLDASFGTAGLKREGSYPHYQRIPVEKYKGDVRSVLKTEYLYFRLKALINRH